MEEGNQYITNIERHVDKRHSFSINKYKVSIKIWKIQLTLAIMTFTFVLVFNKSSTIVSNLVLLPFSYIISLLITKNVYKRQQGLALIIIEVVMMCRYIIIPILYSLDENYSGVAINNIGYVEAVWFMTYELIIVSIAMLFWVSIKHKDYPVLLDANKEKKAIRPFTIFVLSFWIFIITVNDKLRGYLLNFNIITRKEMGFNEYISLGEYQSDIPGLFRVFFYIGLVLLFVSIVRFIALRKWYMSIKGLMIGVTCISFVSSMWSSGFSVSRWGLLIATIISVYILIYTFPSKIKQIITIGILVIVSVIIGGSILKASVLNLDSDIEFRDVINKYITTESFDEYFQGIAPVSNGIKTGEIYGHEIGVEQIFVDTSYNFPYSMRILGLSEKKISTYYFHQATGHNDLIMPTVTQSIMQFGKILAPTYSVMLVLLALWFDRKQQASKTVYKKLFFTVLVFWTSLFMAISTNEIEANIWYAVIAIMLLTIEEKFVFTINGQKNK